MHVPSASQHVLKGVAILNSKMKHLLDHFERLYFFWEVVEKLPKSCQGHLHMLISLGGISGPHTTQLQQVTMAVHKQIKWVNFLILV